MDHGIIFKGIFVPEVIVVVLLVEPVQPALTKQGCSFMGWTNEKFKIIAPERQGDRK